MKLCRNAALPAVVLLLSAAPAFAAERDSAAKVRALIARMTLDEKISLLHGARDPEELGQAGYWPGLPRLGIPPLRFADGPPGINANRDGTAMPAPVALAATFSPEAARLFGAVLGREAKALEQNVVLGPHVNLVRDPVFRRNHTAPGEDPLLAARLGAAVIEGVQSQGVMAQAKHFAAYNGANNVAVDERTLHEIYLPPFEAAVRAGVASVMCAYNRVNGEWACGNRELDDVLRKQWHFTGFVVSDWGALRSTGAITRGIDLEMPGRPMGSRNAGPWFADSLKEAVEKGTVPVSVVDRALARILLQLDRFHLLDAKPAGAGTIDVEADARAVRDIATQAAVLLKNDGNALPLAPADIESLALIGPTAAQLAAGYMGERGYGFESRLVSPLDALRRTVHRDIAYSPGVDLTGEPIPAAALSHNGEPGLVRTRSGDDPTAPVIDKQLDFRGPSALASGYDYTWKGTLSIPEDGGYTFLVQPSYENGSQGAGSIIVDGRLVARTGGPGFGGTGTVLKKWSGIVPTTDGRDNGRGTDHLAAGPHAIELTAASFGDAPLVIRFAWITPEFRRRGIEAAVALAKTVRTPVVFAWHPAGHALPLPDDQDELIGRVAAANPRTIIVLNSGGPVAMPWKDKVRAIIEMWYPGQEGGWATADLLLGRANPSGKLPVTFPRRIEDSPAHAPGHPERLAPAGAFDTNAPAAVFSEGIFTGYRWFDQQGIEPLFPFGHGLSYTSFEYSGLAVTPANGGFDVTFSIRNTGVRRGAEVAQVYVGPVENASVPMAPKSLAGFTRVELSPGARQQVRIHIPQRAFSYWSTEKHNWAMPAGRRRIYAGASSRDLRLQTSLLMN